MKNIFIIICFLFLTPSFCQEQKVFTYYVTLNSYNDAPVFEEKDGLLYYIGDDDKQKDIFSKYDVLTFNQAFPDAIDENVLKIFVLETTSDELMSELLNDSSDHYLASEDITERKIEYLYYPNDYGTTSPITNSGANVTRKDLDYIHAPEAWDITKGNEDIEIGISDTAMQYDAPDLYGKVTLVGSTYSSPTGGGFYHGTSVAGFAAARGNNSSGSVGVCMDCNIIAGGAYIGGNYVNGELILATSNLYKMAKAGARVINMSWTSSGYTNNGNSFSSTEQQVINDLANNYRVTLVAAAGNKTSFSNSGSYHCILDSNHQPTGVPTSPFGILYVFPASYDNVISVSTVNHKNPISLPMSNSQASYCCTFPTGSVPIHTDLEDSVGMCAYVSDPNNPIGVDRSGYYQNQWNPDGLLYMHTLNDKVDIVAPGYHIFAYSEFLNDSSTPYGDGTSYSAPLVSGTIGLMLTVNDCLFPNEIENILKLTTKDIENMPLNQNFHGFIGAGKLEVNDAVAFTNEMKKTDGNAIINNHIFNRFNFNLHKINNQLTIQNVMFRDSNISDFTAKNNIEVLGDSDFKPNSTGYVDLKINDTLRITCPPIVYEKKSNNKIKKEISRKTISILYPNPNNGNFTISLSKQIRGDVNVEIYDLYGKLVYKATENQSVFNLSIPSLASGLYVVKLKNSNYEEVLKLIKK